ncbi:MAG TPA: hypothetical protein PLX35_15955 [Cyclobacteriaceae bacterium]|nr:hypothetical protein [Cyclobacteriaceae bacterium]
MKQLLVVLIFLSSSAYAQNAFRAGFIKHLDGRMEYGYIQVMPSNVPSLVCNFKPNPDDLVQELQPSDLISYGFLPGTQFYAIATKPPYDRVDIFAEIIHTGQVTIYKSGNRLLLSLGGRISELFEDDYKITIAKELANCPYVVERVKTSPFTEDAIMYLARSYEKCVRRINPAKFNGTELLFNAFVFGGFDNSNLSFNPSSAINEVIGQSARNSTPYRFGVQVQARYNALSPHIALTIGATYRPLSYSMAYSTTGSTAAYQFKASYSELQIPIGLQLTLYNRKRMAINVQGGAVISRASNFQSHQIFDQRTPQGIYQNESIPATQILSGAGTYLGFGGVIRTNAKYRFAMNIQYQTGSVTMKDLQTTQVSATANSISANLGILF